MSISIEQYLLFTSIVTLIVVSPGPNLFLLLHATPAYGRMKGFIMILGFGAAILSHAFLALVGIGAVIAASATLFTMIKFAGAIYLIWLGVKALKGIKAPPNVPTTPTFSKKISASGIFIKGYLTNILNPKPAVFYVAAFPQFLADAEGLFFATGALLGLTHAFIAVLFYGGVVLIINNATAFLERPAVSKIVKGISGTALILLGGRLLIAKAPN